MSRATYTQEFQKIR